MKKALLTAALFAACGLALARIPAPVLDDAAKAKAAETAAKTAWQAKVDGYLLCKAQDKAAANHKNMAKSLPPKPVVTPVVATPAAPTPAAAASGTTPVALSAALPPAPCADPGPFAYNPPEQKPLETAGAHSPSGTAKGPPSVKQNSAEMKPAGPATPASKKP